MKKIIYLKEEYMKITTHYNFIILIILITVHTLIIDNKVYIYGKYIKDNKFIFLVSF
jgi:hypothetical protein